MPEGVCLSGISFFFLVFPSEGKSTVLIAECLCRSRDPATIVLQYGLSSRITLSLACVIA
jgi:hypothetical protein